MVLVDQSTALAAPAVLAAVSEDDIWHVDPEKALEAFYLGVLCSKQRTVTANRLRIRISLVPRKERGNPAGDWVRMALKGRDKCIIILKEEGNGGMDRLLYVLYRDPSGGSKVFV